MKIVVTGATGFIGRAVVVSLARQGHDLVSVVRKSGSASDLPSKSVNWDSSQDSPGDIASALKKADAVIHLAGEPVAKSRWGTEAKESIRSSRVLGTQKIVDALASLRADERPKILICGSAIGIYGDRGDELLTEEACAGQGFLSDVVKSWEAEAIRAEPLGVRVVRLRTGIVLGLGGGALEQMQPVVLGSGKQWMSWIHLDDVVSFIRFAIEESSVSGAFNLVAPNPETNASFTHLFSKAIGLGPALQAPSFALKVAMGEMSSILLDSTRVVPMRTTESGFKFRFERLSDALRDLYPAPLEKRLSTTQFVPQKIEKVFDYFSRASNLEELTPPWLNFHIVGTSTQEMGTGTLIDYRLKIHGLPIRWQSRIEDWEPGKKFVDTQIKGPYKKWHHTHSFEEVAGGTLVRDEVIYRLPAGKVGSLFGSRFVKGDIEKIFSYRRTKIAEVFGS
jgi:uncharacterized protein (TIGR01777 family)